MGFRAWSSVQRVAEPRYLRASCQRVSPEDMRITVAFPGTLLATRGFGATSRRDVVVRVIRDGLGLGARADVRFGEARGMVASVRGYLLFRAIARVGVSGALMMAASWDCAWDSSRCLAR